MSLDLHVLTDVALALDPADRLALASLLIDSVEDAVEPGWEASWTEELHRRSAAADSRPVRGAPWADVRDRILRNLARR